MKTSKRPWTRAELALFATPLLFLLIGGGVWFWRRTMPYSISPPNARNITGIEFSPDGSRLAVFFNQEHSSVFSGQIYDVQTRSQICDLSPPQMPPSIPGSLPPSPYFYWPSWSPDGKRIVAGYKNDNQFIVGQENNLAGKMALWDSQTGALRVNGTSHGYIYFSGDGKTLISARSTFDALTGRQLSVSTGIFANANEKTINRKLGFIALRSPQPRSPQFERIQVFDLKTKKVVWETQIKRFADAAWCGDILAISSWRPRPAQTLPGDETSVLLWNGKTRAALPSPRGGTSTDQIVFNPAQNTILLVNSQPRSQWSSEIVNVSFAVWSLPLKRALWSHAMPSRISGMKWSPDGRYLSMQSDDYNTTPTKIWVFDRAGKVCLEREAYFSFFRWSPDSTNLAVIFEALTDNTNTMTSPARVEIIHFPK